MVLTHSIVPVNDSSAYEDSPGIYYGDAGGKDDVVSRERAAQEITSVFRKGKANVRSSL